MTQTQTTGHALRRLEQIPPANPARYPTRAQWVCECGETGQIRARWGTQAAASMQAHARHAAAALEAQEGPPRELLAALCRAVGLGDQDEHVLPATMPLMLSSGRATHDGHPCRFAILTDSGTVWVELDAPKTPDGPTAFPAQLDQLDDVVWNFPQTSATQILALTTGGAA